MLRKVWFPPLRIASLFVKFDADTRIGLAGRRPQRKDDYCITILSDNSLQIDGRPHTSDKEATHHGLELDSAPAPLAGEEKPYHKLELLVAEEEANLGLLKKVLQDRMQVRFSPLMI